MEYQALGYTEREAVSQDVDRETFERIKKAETTCLFALELEEKFALLFDNFAEFEVELLRLAEFSLLWKGQALEYANSMQQRVLLDRRLVNVLTSCRLYLDQTDHGLSTVFGKSSSEATAVKEFKNRLYDSHWGYRLMEAVRNHVQHAGLPVQRITFDSCLIERANSSYAEFTVYPQASLKTLSEDKQFKRGILQELQEKDEQLDLRGPVREYMSCFVILHDKLRQTIKPVVEAARTKYEAAIKDYSTLGGCKIRYPSLVEFSDAGEKTYEIYLHTTFLDYYDQLLKRNSLNNDIHHSAASNTDQKRK